MALEPLADWSWMAPFLGPYLHPGGEVLSHQILEAAAVAPGDTLVDLGAGAGATLTLAAELHPGLRVVGIDPKPFMSRRRGPALAVRGSGPWLPLRDASVQAIVAECSLCLMEPLPAVLGEARRALRPGGRLVFSDFYRIGDIQWSSDRLAAWACVLDARPDGEILSALTEAGFGEVLLEDRSASLWEIEERVQKRVDVLGLVEALARSGTSSLWSSAADFLAEVRRARDMGLLRYGIFSATRSGSRGASTA